jgi:hypothetical protein
MSGYRYLQSWPSWSRHYRATQSEFAAILSWICLARPGVYRSRHSASPIVVVVLGRFPGGTRETPDACILSSSFVHPRGSFPTSITNRSRGRGRVKISLKPTRRSPGTPDRRFFRTSNGMVTRHKSCARGSITRSRMVTFCGRVSMNTIASATSSERRPAPWATF